MRLDALFRPKSIAVIGASEKPTIGRRLIASLDRIGFPGRIFPVNPNYPTVLGRPCYPSIAETPEIPEAGICARPGLPPVAIQALKRALLGMKKPEHATALKGIYDIDGFVEARDADYDPVRDALTLMDYRPRR